MTIEDGRPVQTREIQRLFSSRGLPRSLSRATFLALASFLVVAAVLFPAQQLEHRRAANLDARRNELSLQSSGLQPWDDTYTKVANTPYPINTVKTFSRAAIGGCSSAGHPCRNPFKVRVEERASHKSGAVAF